MNDNRPGISDSLRDALSGDQRGLLAMIVLATAAGLLAALVIIAFRFSLEGLQHHLLDGGTESYEELPTLWRFAVPALAGLLLGLLFHFLRPEQRQVGVVHSLERLIYHQGRLPLVNAMVQFIGGAISMAAGHSVGREGPAIHLGAAAGSQLQERLRLPRNSGRVLIACGVSAAISASFNTPLAGVIFTLEVLFLEYRLPNLIPVIIATVTATLLTQAVFGPEAMLVVPPMDSVQGQQFIGFMLSGAIIGLLAAAYNTILLATTRRSQSHPILLRLSLAGLLTGVVAVWVPEVMGLGYDTMSAAALGEIGLFSLALIVLAKLLITSIGLGLGLPGGLIGPSLFLGATCGGLLGLAGGHFLDLGAEAPAQFALVGMGAMMAAVLRAPLAALMAIFELTQDSLLILPGIISIVAAGVVSNELMRQPGIFLALLRARGLDYRNDPLAQALRQVAVAHVMDRGVDILGNPASRSELEQRLRGDRQWLLWRNEQGERRLIPTVDLQRHLLAHPDLPDIDLKTVPGRHPHLGEIDSGATLQEAWEQLLAEDLDLLLVIHPRSTGDSAVRGILNRTMIENYRPRQPL